MRDVKATKVVRAVTRIDTGGSRAEDRRYGARAIPGYPGVATCSSLPGTRGESGEGEGKAQGAEGERDKRRVKWRKEGRERLIRRTRGGKEGVRRAWGEVEGRREGALKEEERRGGGENKERESWGAAGPPSERLSTRAQPLGVDRRGRGRGRGPLCTG